MSDQTRINWGIGLIGLGVFGLLIFPNMPIMDMIKINWKWLPSTSIISLLGGLYFLISGIRSTSRHT